MTRVISKVELQTTLTSVLESISDTCFVVEDERGATVAAIVSPKEYEFIRRKQTEDAIAAMRELGEQPQRIATPAEIDELERELIAREARAERAIAAMDAFSDHMRSVTTPEELDAIEKQLHQSARWGGSRYQHDRKPTLTLGTLTCRLISE